MVSLVFSLWLFVGILQTPTQPAGSLAGRVVDQTGEPLPGVVVVLSSPGRHHSCVTSRLGEYVCDAAPGRYDLTFALPGFAQHSREGVDIGAGVAITLDVQLQIGLRTEVTVTARDTFRNLADSERPESNLVGLAASASEGAVTARQIERRPIARAGEIVEAVPGAAVTQHSGEGKANQYYLRGFNLDHGTDFSTVVASVPMNLPTHAHGHGYTDVNFLIPELVTGVQYFKGPYTADAGDFSSAGGVSINYASVLDAPRIGLSAGGQGWGRVFAAASPAIAGGRLLAAAELAHNDGPWERPDDYRRHNGILRFTRGDNVNNFAVTAVAYRGAWEATDQVPQRAIDAGAIGRFGGIDATTGGTTYRYAASAELQRGNSSTRTRVTAYAVAYALDLFSNFTYFLDDPVNGDQFHQSDRRLITGVRASHERRGRWADRPVDFRAGLQVRRDDIGLVGLYRTRERRRLSTVREDAVDQASGALWGDLEVRWTPWLRSIAGLRADGYRFDVEAGRRENSGTALAGMASPKGSIVLGPWQGTELYVNAGRGFHSNDARGATMTVGPVDGSPVDRVTPLARTRGAEIGVRTVRIRGVQSTLALWRLSLDSELVFVGDAGTTSPSRPSERQGVEWTNFIRLRPWLSADLDVAWSRARFTDHAPDGPYVPGALDRMVSAGLSAEGSNRISGSVRWRYFGPRALVEDGSVRSRATSLVNARVGYRLSRRLSIALDAFNLLDAGDSDIDYFYTSRLPGESSAGVDDVHLHPALPRTFRTSLTIGF
jgi:hypothetical protein